MRFPSVLVLVAALVIGYVLGAPLDYGRSGALPKTHSDVRLSSHGPYDVTLYGQDSVVPTTPPEGALILPRAPRVPVKTLSVEELKKEMTVPADKVLFYSGPDNYMAIAAREAKDRGLKILQDLWNVPGFAKGQPRTFFEPASKALAQSCKGTVYVLLPSDTTGTKWLPGTIWDKVEWPTLIKNPAVTKIVRLKEKDAHSQEVIHPLGHTPSAGGPAHAEKAVPAGGGHLGGATKPAAKVKNLPHGP